jgi:cyclomaltodextrinase
MTEVFTPDWVKHAIFYQIFPDRFAKSASLEKPNNLEPWDTEPTAFGYKGGDLLGVVERLDYLQDLGVTALSFNPIFQSACNHRYHTHDYYRVDPLLGGDEAFDSLLAECKRRGLRIILDGVFNHCSRGFFQFNDVLENGAASPWVDWFHFAEHPANAYDHGRPPGYTAWVGLHALPKLNTDNPQVREYLMSVAEYWLRKGIDGWRLDVPFEIISMGFWQEFRQRMKAINPEAYLVGEVWWDARPWLQGDQFDGVMNYLFAEAAIAFTAGERVQKELVDDRPYYPWPGIDGTTFAEKIDHVQRLYDWQIQLTHLNLLDGHDTARFISIADGDAASVRLGTLLMLTFPGAPCIYYGDEIGLTGGRPDAMARRPFPWDHPDRWDHDTLDFHKEVIALRKAHPALRTGTFSHFHAAHSVYIFERSLDDERIVVAENVGQDSTDCTVSFQTEPSVLLSTGGEPVLVRSGDQFKVTLPARSGAVFGDGIPR